MVERPPRPDRWGGADVGAVLAILGVASLVSPNRLLQYGAWLAVVSLWMAWFVHYGTRWLFDR